MQAKYLPIGSIVTINDSNKKIMIIGYYSIKYMNVVKMFDYLGCVYPEGMLLPSNLYSFNHSDIINVDYLGYEDESYHVLNNNLLNKQAVKSPKKDSNFVNMKYDNNGVVIYDELPELKIDPDIASLLDSIDIQNPFVIKTKDNATPKAEKPVMIEDIVNEEVKIDLNSKPKYVDEDFYEEENQSEKDAYAIPHYRFDENGIIISE